MPNRLLLLVAVFLLALPLTLAAEDSGGKIEAGIWTTDEDGSEDRAAEFEPTGTGPLLDLEFFSLGDNGAFRLESRTLEADHTENILSFDVKRILRSVVTYDKFLHRLGHDPLRQYEAATSHGRVVHHTDYDPTQQYEIGYGDFFTRNELQFPNMGMVTLAIEYMNKTREGHTQAFTVSHCDTCHVESRNRPVDESTRGGTVELATAWTGGTARARFTSLEHEQGVPYILHTYDDALHPEQRLPLFDNRVQYDSADGPIPIDLMPDIDKEKIRLDLSFDSVGGFAVSGGGVWAATENQYTSLESEYTGFAVNAARTFDNGWRVRWRGRSYALDNDDIFVDTVEPVATAGPHAGKTYREVYGFNPDFLRLSVMNRDVLESALEAKRKIGKRHTVGVEWKFENTDRDHYEVAVGETETTENIVGLSWSMRPSKGMKAGAVYRHAEIDNPFMLINGACSTFESTAVPSPFHPDAGQYYEFHRTRVADTTASPESWDELKLSGSWTSGTSVLTGMARIWEGDNTSGDLTEWSKSHHSATLTYGMTPAPNWNWYAGWTWADAELESPTCVPVFDG